MISFILSVVVAAAPADKPLAVALSSFVKVRPGSEFVGSPDAKLSAARGECEAVQIRVGEDNANVTLTVPPLTGASPHTGAPIAPSLFVEDFIEVKTPSNSEGAVGLWPDPLRPLLPGSAQHSEADRPLVYYVELCVPLKQKPGKYTSTMEVASGARRLKLPLSLTVQPFAIPPTSSLPNSFGISLYSLAKGHGLDPTSPQARTLLSEYAKSALRHRISLHGMGMDPLPVKFEGGKAKVDFRAYDEELEPFLSGTALPSGARFTTAEVRDNPKLTDDQRALYYAALRDHFLHKSWPQLLFFYAKDEPKPADFPKVVAQARTVRRASGIPVLVTAPLTDALKDSTDILCPVMNCYFERPGPKTCNNVQPMESLKAQLGPRRAWWYQSCMSHGCDEGPIKDPAVEKAFSGWPSYMVDHPIALNRAMGPLAFLTGVQGELYFSTVFAYNVRDPWTGLWDFGGNGDGTLFYPGTPARIGGTENHPVESLRLKAIRDGLEDYEYAHLLDKLGDGAAARDAVKTVIKSGYDIRRDETSWRGMREKLTLGINARWAGSEYARRWPVSE
ncbi:MAG: DUF4091 domain-containing protein [Myxococcaceae bacterium]